MRNLKQFLNKEFFKKAVFIVFILFLFFVNSLHESYPDEFDNILGGWFILHGKFPYVGFFTHHGPMPYFIASIIEIFSGQSFVKFRMIYALALGVWFLFTYNILKKSVGEQIVKFYLYFIVFVGFLSTYYWNHMLLADNIAAFTLLPAYGLIFLKDFLKKTITLKDIILISLLSVFALYSSLTYTYFYLILIFYSLFLYYKNNLVSFKEVLNKKSFLPLIIILIPHLLLFFYFIVSSSFLDYMYQNFTFNIKYYVYNYPRSLESGHINPIRFAVVIANNFYNDFHALIAGFNLFNFGNPMNMTMALGNVGLIIYLLFKKNIKLAIFVFLLLIYANARSSPLKSGETDYQSAVYIFFSFFNIFFFLPEVFKEINEERELLKKIIFSVLFILVSFHSFFAFLYVVRKFNEKFFAKYMGTQSLIYDRPRLSPIVNLVTTKEDYAWIGPFNFEDLFYMNAKIPSKYHILIRGIGISEKSRNDMLADFKKNTPRIIIFDKDFTYITYQTYSYSGFFIKFLNENYLKLSDYREGSSSYFFPDATYPGNMAGKVFIRKDSIREVVEKLKERGYIKRAH